VDCRNDPNEGSVIFADICGCRLLKNRSKLLLVSQIMSEDKLQPQRFELKYRVNAHVALAIRDFVSSYLVLDEYSVGKPNFSYANHSIYLDSPDLRLVWDTINGNKNRYKLRLRFYDDDPNTPIFFEIKRRSNEAIIKRRAPIRREAVPSLLAGHLPAPDFLFSYKPQYLVAIQEFSRLMADLQAAPKTHVAYLREAWVSPNDNSVRVTLDRDVCAQPHSTAEISTRMESFVTPFAPDVILEIKFTSRYPDWLRQLVEIFGVMQCGAAKYVEGVTTLGEDNLNPDYMAPESQDLIERFLARRSASSSGNGDEPLLDRRRL
jgi:SPX domain protein involved in polyphosphate accumulation